MCYDGIHYHTLGSTNNYYVYQSFTFVVSESTSNIAQLVVEHDGFATQTTKATPDASTYNFYVWNFTSTGYSYIGQETTDVVYIDETKTITLTSGFADIIDGSGNVRVLVENTFQMGTGSNARKS